MKTEYFNIFIIATIGRLSLIEAIKSIQNQQENHLIVVVFDDEEIIRPIIDDDIVY